MDSQNELQLSVLSDDDRIISYQKILDGCHHVWTKGKLQREKLTELLSIFIRLADDDPIFLAHFTSYVVKKLDNKDLKVLLTFINSISDADGTELIIERNGKKEISKYKKPNLRIISQAAIQELDPKLVLRIIELANIKQSLGKRYQNIATHFSKSLKTAIRKWLKYREHNLKAIEGIRRVGYTKTMQRIYRLMHISPTTEVAEILRWKQKDGRQIVKKDIINFSNMKDINIAKKIVDDKISPIVALGALPDKISPVIAVAILNNATADQTVILKSMYEKQGLLEHDEIRRFFENKIKNVKNVDRIDSINNTINSDVKKILNKTKSDRRKEKTGDIGKVFLHIDISSSMVDCISFAKEKGSIIAECIKNPEQNFGWGTFNTTGKILPNPENFEANEFYSILYGIRASGMTDCLANYIYSRSNNFDVDIFLTDQGHNGKQLKSYFEFCNNQGYKKPTNVVIIDFQSDTSWFHPRGISGPLEAAFLDENIPVTVIQAGNITSELLTTTLKTAIIGKYAVIDDIMNTPLLTLPKWWNSI